MTSIIRVAARGEGVAEDGRHIPFAAPGDDVAADGTVVPGPHHQTPPCRHFPTCGGCQLQHLDDESWSGFIVDRIAGALAAQGIDTDIRTPSLSPPRTRRRATLHAERKGGRIVLGFTEPSSHTIVDITECHVLAPDLFAVVAPLRKLLATLGLKRRADIHLTRTDQGIDLLVTGLSPDGLAAAETVTAFAERNALARFAFDDGYGAEVRWEPQPVTITLGGIPVALPPASFLQATEEGEAALVEAVREGLGDAQIVADLFSGLGTFALSLPGKVYAAEAGRDAVMALKSAASARHRPVFVEHRDLFRRPLTPAELDRFAGIVLDPPRAGAREQATALAASRTGRIAYVSCNPSSLARDAKTLMEGGWRLDWVQPVGQFRWSTHVELAAQFSRSDNPPG